jgi:hypothetical protein
VVVEVVMGGSILALMHTDRTRISSDGYRRLSMIPNAAVTGKSRQFSLLNLESDVDRPEIMVHSV